MPLLIGKSQIPQKSINGSKTRIHTFTKITSTTPPDNERHPPISNPKAPQTKQNPNKKTHPKKSPNPK